MQQYEGKVATEGLENSNGAQRVYIVTVPLSATTNVEAHIMLTNVKGLRLQCRDGTAFRVAFELDKVGSATPADPYATVLANGHVTLRHLDVKELHIYLACGTGGKVVEIIVWK